VSSLTTPTGRVHARQRARASSATAVSHGTASERGRNFTPGPKPANLPKRYVVAHVQKNYLSFLFVGQKAKMFVLRGLASRLISPGLKIAALRRDLVREVERRKVMYFGTSKFIAVRLMSLLYFDRRFHVRMDFAMIGIGTSFRKRERKGTDNLGHKHSDLAW
jgi:hypothetical protein